VRDYNAPNGSRWAVDESHGSVVYDAGFSFEPAIDTADQPPSQTQALQGLGTQFDHSDTILDHFFTKEGKKVTNADPEFIATWLRNKREEPGDREDSHFIPINQRMRVMTYRNIYEELLRAGMLSAGEGKTPCRGYLRSCVCSIRPFKSKRSWKRKSSMSTFLSLLGKAQYIEERLKISHDLMTQYEYSRVHFGKHI
jgi:hypothetical protein